METCLKIIVICGPTDSGKSNLALRLAKDINAEIINADSQQVYQGLDIGTAKPSDAEQAGIPHHLIDCALPGDNFSAALFATAADKAIRDIAARGKKVIVVGGTGLYIRALIHGLVDSPSGDADIRAELLQEAADKGAAALYDELRQVDAEAAAHIHPNNLVRVVRALEVFRLTGAPLSRFQLQHGFRESRYHALLIALDTERSELYRRIDHRVDRMVEAGLVNEVRDLLAAGIAPDAKAMQAIGYKETVAHLAGHHDLNETIRLIKRNTRHYAKRQLTWFRADPAIQWFAYPEKYATILKHVIDFFDQKEC
jgi:tRNA dimethylallyltransferase